MAASGILRWNAYPFSTEELEEAGEENVRKATIADFQKEVPGKFTAFYTFLDDGYEKCIVTLVVTNEPVEMLHVNARDRKMDEAILWVVNHNPHLRINTVPAEPPVSINVGTELHSCKLQFEEILVSTDLNS